MTRDVRVASADLPARGAMAEVAVGDTKLLLVRLGDGSVHALGAACPHYGAPLAKGLLCQGRVVCPWHKSVFEVSTGGLCEPPALDGLPRFPVRATEGGDVVVALPDEAPPKAAPSKALGFAPDGDGRTFVVVGAGAAGGMAAQTLREAGFRGRLVMLGREDEAPYDRPKLSKDFLAGTKGVDALPLRAQDFYDRAGIERRVGIVTAVDPSARTVVVAGDPEPLAYDALLLATGAAPNPLDVPGSDLGGVHLLRTAADAERIVGELRTARRAVVVGGSFIAFEGASSLRRRGIQVDVVMPDPVPFAKALGTEVGRALLGLHRRDGVEVHPWRTVARFEGANGSRVRAVALAGGERFEADLVLVGIGVKPVLPEIRGVEAGPSGGLDVDGHMAVVGAPGVFAAGDVAAFPHPLTGERGRIEHWRLAEQLGRTAALNMAGVSTTYSGVPYFWSNQAGVRLEYVGHATRPDEVIVEGDPRKPDFIAYYVQGGRAVAAAAVGRDEETAAFHELLRRGAPPEADALRDGRSTPVALLAAATRLPPPGHGQAAPSGARVRDLAR